ncbi:MAG TPA: BlaI/MecI/CopY family transcriptional regulator [Micromonosporaceae bacterium]|nr:BlaI/MecI/CopY family transcriptional regulator [Micromonosporaceae bacterium]
MQPERRRRGDLAQQIFDVLADADAPMTAAEVREALDPTLAYNTVLTVLTRLHEKGEVSRQQAGRPYAYRAVTDRAAVTAWRMQQLLDADDDRAGVLTRFHGSLSAEDAAVLAELIATERRDGS